MSNKDDPTLTRVSTLDGVNDPYDHAISLIDTTAIANQNESRARSRSPSWRELARKPTKGSVKDHFARRKYAKWAESKYSNQTDSSAANDEDELQPEAAQPPPELPSHGAETETVDFANGKATDKGKASAEVRTSRHTRKEPPYEVDVMYENQRGAFFCGIPLYSHASLLNFDPSPWSTKDFRDSPVNITNAQVPDPSWEWAWKTWYVDMSHDVDEEGWQYSFTFGRNFAWHGTHPWFHSFVRRRRWLRKRVKKGSTMAKGKAGSLNAAHTFTADYFTIHPKRDKSPASAIDGAIRTARPASYVSYTSNLEDEELPKEINDIATLLKALRMASVDREKVDMVKRFVQHGGDELAYLREHIPDIMSFLIFQNSKQQLLKYLKRTASEAQQHREEHDAEQKPEGDAERRRIDNLLAAVDAANKQISGLEYWSDRKHVLKTADDESMKTRAISTIFDAPAPGPKVEENPVGSIKGISENADIQMDPTHETVHRAHGQAETNHATLEDKGKGRERDSEDDGVGHDETPRLGVDDMLVPEKPENE